MFSMTFIFTELEHSFGKGSAVARKWTARFMYKTVNKNKDIMQQNTAPELQAPDWRQTETKCGGVKLVFWHQTLGIVA